MEQQNAKFSFYYLLSLVALIFMALSTGMIIFQIINKYVIDILEANPGLYDSSVLKFAISAIIIATPIFYLLSWQIQKSLKNGALAPDSGVRKWLTYFILFISSVVMIGWLIAVINSFLNGELSTKFLLKSLASILISGAVFGFYFYDIKRKDVQKKDNVISIFFYTSLVFVIGFFVASMFIVESPTETRNRKFDDVILQNFDQIDSAINQYYTDKKKLPDNLDQLKADYSFINDDILKNKVTGTKFDYKVLEKNKYQLCSNFLASNKNVKDATYYYSYNKDRWPHDSGYQCLSQKVLAPDLTKPGAVNPIMP